MSERIDLSPDDLKRVEEYASLGVTWDGIASILGISRRSLIRHANDQYHRGIHVANAAVAGELYKKAMSGDTASMCFWLKCRARWREKDREDVDRVELTGKDGEPLWSSPHDKIVALAARLVERKSVAGDFDPADPDGGR